MLKLVILTMALVDKCRFYSLLHYYRFANPYWKCKNNKRLLLLFTGSYKLVMNETTSTNDNTTPMISKSATCSLFSTCILGSFMLFGFKSLILVLTNIQFELKYHKISVL